MERPEAPARRFRLTKPAARRDPMRPSVLVPGLALAAVGTALLGVRIGNPWLLPLLNAAPAYAVMLRLVVSGRRFAAFLSIVWWAACLGASMTVLCAVDPWGTATAAVHHGPEYFQEMRAWVETGRGCESTPACFVPVHLRHAAIFMALALASAGALALVLGAVLMNYMAYFVGSLTAAAVTPVAVAAISWFPWSLVRIVSFIALGTALAEPLVFRVTRRPAPPGRAIWIAVALAGLLLDIALKAWLAPRWPFLLRPLLHG
ncbi:MAG: hypothetical protein HY049_02415 [Acidobacteria bacterium]|nr:hypothetical protein [Acidobacteriota bacterium]